MTLEKPKIENPGVTLTARDKINGSSKTITIYNTTPEAVIERVTRILKDDEPDSEALEHSRMTSEGGPEPKVTAGKASSE